MAVEGYDKELDDSNLTIKAQAPNKLINQSFSPAKDWRNIEDPSFNINDVLKVQEETKAKYVPLSSASYKNLGKPPEGWKPVTFNHE